MFSKIDLHLHLDGSLDPRLAYEMAAKDGYKEAELPFEEFQKLMIVPPVASLKEFLDCFDLPIKLLQTYDNLMNATYDLVKREALNNFKYIEIRFATQNHLQKGLTQEEALQAVIEGAKKAMEDYPSIEVNIINCMMIFGDPSINDEANLETVRLTKKYLNKGVCLLDLAGAEGSAPFSSFKKYFDLANEIGLPFTIHAGEAGPGENVKLAVSYGAKRIGHGGHVIEEPDTVKYLADHHIALEMCLTSNIQCKNQPSYKDHALKPLYEQGVWTTINTDNMTLSDITIDDEYNHVLNDLKLSQKDLLQMMIYSAKSSCASEKKKQELINEYEKMLQNM